MKLFIKICLCSLFFLGNLTSKAQFCTTDDLKISPIEFNKLPYFIGHTKLSIFHELDKDSIPMACINSNLVYNPVSIAHYALHHLDIYIQTEKVYHLHKAINIAIFLRKYAIMEDEALFFQYQFDYILHSNIDTMKAPWVSGMAQGTVLSLYSRLYQITHNFYYQVWANQVFNSIKTLRSQDNKFWTSYVNHSYYLWIEEYPLDTPANTLNGMIYAIYGLYDYYWITKNEIAYQYLNASLTTIRENVKYHRNKGGVSLYCLKHRHKSEFYHTVHYKQMLFLYKITRDSYFKYFAGDLKLDYSVTGVN